MRMRILARKKQQTQSTHTPAEPSVAPMAKKPHRYRPYTEEDFVLPTDKDFVHLTMLDWRREYILQVMTQIHSFICTYWDVFVCPYKCAHIECVMFV